MKKHKWLVSEKGYRCDSCGKPFILGRDGSELLEGECPGLVTIEAINTSKGSGASWSNEQFERQAKAVIESIERERKEKDEI
jgi:hypothetical protein